MRTQLTMLQGVTKALRRREGWRDCRPDNAAMRHRACPSARFLVLTGFLAGAAPLLAHDTWIQAREGSIAPGAPARFDVTSGGTFAVFDSAIAPDRIAREGLRAGGSTRRFTTRRREKASLLLSGVVGSDAIATAWLELNPRKLELGPEKVKEYLEEIGEWETIGKTLATPPARWRESYRKQAKTFVRVGTPPEADRSWNAPVGLTLEIVPERDPTTLHAGEALPVRVLWNGRPLAGFGLVASAAEVKEHRIVRTDPEGRATVSLDRAGRWLLAGTRLAPSHKPGLEWESDFTTLTLIVPAAPAGLRTPRPEALVPDQPFVGTPRPSANPYQEIVRLKEAGATDAQLLAKVERESVPYALTTPQIQALRAAGVSQSVIEAMLRSGRAVPTPR